MTATLPLPIAPDEESRSDAGLFASKDEQEVLRRLGQDLQGFDRDDLLSQYRHASATSRTSRGPGELIDRVLKGEARPEDLRAVVKLLYFSGHQSLLAKYHLRFPAYNILDEYFVNASAL